MKPRSLTTLFLLLLFSRLFVSSSPAQSVERVAKVVRLEGSARYSTGNYVWTPIKVGDVLHPGMIIQTSNDQGTYVDLAFGDGATKPNAPHAVVYKPYIVSSMAYTPVTFKPTTEQNVVRVWGDSALGIDTLTGMQTGEDIVTETQLDLKRGRITGNVKKLSAGSKYEVKFPNGVAAIRGTLFDIQAVGIIKVHTGSLVVAWVDPRTQQTTTQNVAGGQVYDVASNQVSFLTNDSIDELTHLSSSLGTSELFIPTPMMLTRDQTVVGMSPVGANPSSIPNPEP